MIIITNTSQITKGNAHLLIERFDKIGKVEYMSGFLGLEVLLTENTKEHDEVTVVTRWEKKRISMHGQKVTPLKSRMPTVGKFEYIVSNKISFYEVKIVRQPIAAAQ